MDIQDMFNKAYIGLRSQGFQQCYIQGEGCMYSDGNGKHCAWGWVDPESWEIDVGSVDDLHNDGVGIAATLNEHELYFANKLQNAHDNTTGLLENNLQDRLIRLAAMYSLTVPE